MQSLDVISINIWQILSSMCNLLILFLVVKRFLFQPVQRMMAQRQENIDNQYAQADQANKEADRNRQAWEEKMRGAQSDADRLIAKATATADKRGEQIVLNAREKADGLIREAQAQAELEHRKAQAEIKREIVDVSETLAEKLLKREINAEDHRVIIASVLEEMGEDHDGDQ